MTRARHPRALATTALLGGLAATVLAGCDSSGSSAPTTSASVPSSPAVSTPASTSPVPSTSAPSSPPPTSSPSSSPPASSVPPSATPTRSAPPALAACSRLDVAVTRVPGGAGIGYGLVSVTNRGTSRCGLPGIPVLRLLGADHGALTPAAKAATPGDGTALDPGAVASTLLADRSDNCQANTRSVYLEVTATPSSGTVSQPLALPPCTLSVKPFVPGTEPAP